MKQILIPLTSTLETRPLLDYSFALTRRLQARAVVANINPISMPPAGELPASTSSYYKLMVEHLVAQEEHDLKAQRQTFEDAAREATLPTITPPSGACAIWADPASSEHDAIWRNGRLADLIVARRPTGRLSEHAVVEEALFGVRRPTLMIPLNAFPADRRALVAWNGSLESIAALQAAVRIIPTDHKIVLMQVGEAASEAISLDQAAAYLTTYGYDVVLETVAAAPKKDATPSLILETLERFRAGMLVCGAFTHGRFHQLVLGGVTTVLMSRCPVPLLMAR